MDIRNHRFVPTIKVATKVIKSKKDKARTRRALNKAVRDLY